MIANILPLGWLILSLHLGVSSPSPPSDSLRLIQTIPTTEGMNRIWLDAEANIWTLAPEQGGISKFLKAWTYDSLIHIGGRSMRNDGLIHPIKLALPTRQRVYVLDEVSRKVLLLTTNLKVAEARDFQASLDVGSGWQDVYPISFAVNGAEDMYILDGQDNRVIAFNALGEERFRFGGLDYGQGALRAPTDILVSPDGRLLVVPEPSLNRLQVFDLFGVYRYTYTIQDSLSWTQARIFGNTLCLLLEQGCWIQGLEGQGKGYKIDFPGLTGIKDLFIQGDLLYLLMEKAIQIYHLPSP